jgi:hexosaminidase
MSPPDYCLFSRYQGNPDHQPQARDGISTLAHVYSFDPIPLSTPKRNALNIIGAQCILSTEYFPTEDMVEYMLLPRLLAFSESLWSTGESKTWNRFRRNVEDQKIRLRAKGYSYCEGSFIPIVHTRKISDELFSVTISTEVPNTYVFYTTDGRTPSRNSQVYVSPFQIAPNTTLKLLPVYHDHPQDSVYEYLLP